MDNTTLYRSPVRLVGHAGEPIGEYSPQTISRAKKKLLALISLSDNEMELNGMVYTKNDIISLLDGITDETIWRYHCMVYALPSLLSFLEDGYFDSNDITLKNDVAVSNFHGFTVFVSPWMAVAFNRASGNLLRPQPVAPQPAQLPLTYDAISARNPSVQVAEEPKEPFKELTVLLGYQHLILPEHQHIAFERIRIYFHELLYTLRNLSWEKFERDESVLYFVFTSSWTEFANSLPTAFAATRDDVAHQVTDIAIHFQHKATWHYLHVLCDDLKNLECNEELKSEIKRLSQHFQRNATLVSRAERNRQAEGSSSGPSVGRVIVWCIWIVLAIIRISSCTARQEERSFLFENSSSPSELLKQNEEDAVPVVDSESLSGYYSTPSQEPEDSSVAVQATQNQTQKKRR